jgi:hypothetical protein
MDRSQQWARPGVEHQRARAVSVDELASDGGVGRVGGDGDKRVAELRPQVLEPDAVAGDADDGCASFGERGGDGAAEASAGASDER